MALSTKVGSFEILTSDSGNKQITGVGFQPKVLILHYNGRSDSTDAVGAQTIYHGWGFATSSTDRRCAVALSTLGQASATGALRYSDAACMITCGDTGTEDGNVDFVSFDAGGFTLAVDDAPPVNLRVMYIAVGGDDVTNVQTGQFQTPAAVGNNDVTNAGFQPDILFFLSAPHSSTPPASLAGGIRIMFGAAKSSTKQYVISQSTDDGSANMDTASYIYDGEFMVTQGFSNPFILDNRLSFVEMLSNGFRYNALEAAASGHYVFYLAIKGGQWDLGDLLTQTDTTTTVTETGLLFQPSLLLFASANRAKSTQDAGTAHAQTSFGAATSTTERMAMAIMDEDGTANSETATAIEYDEVYANISTGDVIQGLMDLSAINSDGFSVIMDDADPVQSFVWWVAAGSESAGTQYNESVSGGITPSGGILKQDNKPLAGSLSSIVGTLSKESSKTYSGGISPSGAVTKQANKTLSGAITSITGAITTAIIFGKILVGVIAPTGDILKQAQKLLSGSNTPSGTLSNQGQKVLSGNVTPVGTISKLTSKFFIGAITSIIGTLEATKTALISLGGTLTSSGNLTKQGQKAFSGSVTPSGVLTRITEKLLSGAINSIEGTLDRAKQAVKALEGTLTSSGSTQKQSNKPLTGSITSTGSILKTTLKNLLGALSNAGDLIADFIPGGGNQFFQTISGGITPIGNVLKSTAKSFAGSLTSEGSLLKSASKFFTGTMTQSGSVSKSTNKAFTGNTTPSGVLSVTKTFIKAIEGAVTFVGTIAKQTGKQLSGTISSTGTIGKLISLFLSGVLIPVGAVNKLIQQVLSGELSLSGIVTTLTGDFEAIISKIYLEGRYALRATLEGLASRTTRLSGVHKAIVSLLGTLEDD